MRVALLLLTPTNPCTCEHTGMAVWAGRAGMYCCHDLTVAKAAELAALHAGVDPSADPSLPPHVRAHLAGRPGQAGQCTDCWLPCRQSTRLCSELCRQA